MNQSHEGIAYKTSHEIALDMPHSDRLIRPVLQSHPIRSKLTNQQSPYNILLYVFPYLAPVPCINALIYNWFIALVVAL